MRRRRIARRGTLVAEARTGTGKTAYLVPALLYGGKVIVSTGTRRCRTSCSSGPADGA
jgi:Rad3-related DNA helicase